MIGSNDRDTRRPCRHTVREQQSSWSVGLGAPCNARVGNRGWTRPSPTSKAGP